MKFSSLLLVVGVSLVACTAGSVEAPTASPAPTPVGVVLPQGCKYVGSPVVQADSTTWAFDCGSANADARATIKAALIQAGWVFCGGAGGRDVYTNGNMTIYADNPGSAAGALPHLMQANQRVGNCP